MKNNDWLKNRPIMHRGFYDNKRVIENTIDAFKKAIELNYPIELDVRITKDDTLIVFHDENIKRLTGINKNYYDLTKELPKYKNNKKINTLSEILDFINGRVPLLIELKSGKNFKKLVKKTYDELKNYRGEYALQSFNPNVIKYKYLDELVPIGILFPFKFKSDITNTILINMYIKIYGFSFLSYNIKNMPNKTVENLNIPKLFWLIKTEKEKQLAKSYNGNIIFEYN